MEPWRQNLVEQLRSRNRREVEPFRDLLEQHSKNFEKLSQLQQENMKLKLRNEQLTAAAVSGAAASTGDTGASAEEVAVLKRKVYELQEELTSVHRKKGENAQQIIDMTVKVKQLEEELGAKVAQVEQNKIDKEFIINEMERTKSKLGELEATNQLLKDEYQALQLTLTGYEQKLLKAQKENDQLINQLMEYKERDVALLNRENDEYVRKRRESVKRQLEEAAAESGKNAPVVNVKPTSAGANAGLAPLDSAICTVARVPNRAYLAFDAHDGEVNTVKWAPHGMFMATGGADRKIKLWEISSGKQQQRGTLTGCNGAVMSLDYDPAGVFVVAGSTDFAARVWSCDDFRLRHTLTGHSGKVQGANFLGGDANRACTGSHDRTLKVWDLRSRACTSTLFPGSIVNDLTCLDQLVISGHFDKKLRFYDVRRGTQPTSETLLSGRVTSVDLAKNGTSLIASTRDDRIDLLDLRNPAKPICAFTADGLSVGCDYTRAVFSPDSNYVSVGSSEGSVFVWAIGKPSMPERVLRRHEGVVVAVAWQPAGNSMVSCDKNKQVVVWADI